jgi:hypothetical protein
MGTLASLALIAALAVPPVSAEMKKLTRQSADLEKSLAWIPKDRTIVTVSHHAARR